MDLETLEVTVQRSSWRLASGSRPHVTWSDTGVTVDRLDLVDAGTGREHVTADGTWDDSGNGRLAVAVRGVLIEGLLRGSRPTPRYAGRLDVDAVVSGTRDHPIVSADFSVAQGRVRRLGYERLGGHVDFRDNLFTIDARLDQATGVWLTAAGTVPMSTFDRSLDPQPLRMVVKSSPVSLTLLEGVTDVVRNVNGQMVLDVTVVGTSHDPHFTGRVDLSSASFDVVSSGARYRNGRLALQLSSDRVGVEALHLEDEDRHHLDVTGSLGTHELRVGDLQVTVHAK